MIRGMPEKLCDVHHNWFPHADAARAVRQTNKQGNRKVHDNRYGPQRPPPPAKPSH